MFHEGFTVKHRTMGRTAAWGTFLVGQEYAVAALLGFLSLRSPQDPIGDLFLSIMALLLVLMAPLMVVSMVAVHAYASRELKAYSLTALDGIGSLPSPCSLLHLCSRKAGSRKWCRLS
jgi:membrane associated rhomboid family serine protease